jgi:hypothetical protein
LAGLTGSVANARGHAAMTVTSVAGQFLQRRSAGGHHRRRKWKKLEARRPEAVPLEIDYHTAFVGTVAMSKCSKIREAWARGDRIGALRIAARFFDRSPDTRIFKRGMDAFNNPDFYRQLRQDPDQIMADVLQFLAQKFNLHS